jgi:hypothetical protein
MQVAELEEKKCKQRAADAASPRGISSYASSYANSPTISHATLYTARQQLRRAAAATAIVGVSFVQRHQRNQHETNTAPAASPDSLYSTIPTTAAGTCLKRAPDAGGVTSHRDRDRHPTVTVTRP